MRKAVWSLVLIGLTASTLMMIAGPAEDVAEAEFARVERADVHQVIPINGQLVYAEEQLITAAAPGVASRVCVKAEDRVGAQAALVRMTVPHMDQVLSAFAAGQEAIGEFAPQRLAGLPLQSVVRAEQPCTIRQVYVEEGALVTAGMPLLRISSHIQRVVCKASSLDAERIQPGMWAWISSEGEALCIATIESVGAASADPLTGLEAQEITLIPEKEIEKAEYAAVDADVYLAGSDDVLSLPLNAITERGTVWWVNDERCTEIPAQIVLHDEMRAWVQLPEGMTVAIGEFEEGQRVKEVTP